LRERYRLNSFAPVLPRVLPATWASERSEFVLAGFGVGFEAPTEDAGELLTPLVGSTRDHFVTG